MALVQGISLQLHITVRQGQEGLSLSEIRIIILRGIENNFSLDLLVHTSFRVWHIYSPAKEQWQQRRVTLWRGDSSRTQKPVWFSALCLSSHPQPRLDSPSQPQRHSKGVFLIICEPPKVCIKAGMNKKKEQDKAECLVDIREKFSLRKHLP